MYRIAAGSAIRYFLYKENPVFDTGFKRRYAFDHKSSNC